MGLASSGTGLVTSEGITPSLIIIFPVFIFMIVIIIFMFRVFI